MGWNYPATAAMLPVDVIWVSHRCSKLEVFPLTHTRCGFSEPQDNRRQSAGQTRFSAKLMTRDRRHLERIPYLAKIPTKVEVAAPLLANESSFLLFTDPCLPEDESFLHSAKLYQF